VVVLGEQLAEFAYFGADRRVIDWHERRAARTFSAVLARAAQNR
jgi:hypothetical protein